MGWVKPSKHCMGRKLRTTGPHATNPKLALPPGVQERQQEVQGKTERELWPSTQGPRVVWHPRGMEVWFYRSTEYTSPRFATIPNPKIPHNTIVTYEGIAVSWTLFQNLPPHPMWYRNQARYTLSNSQIWCHSCLSSTQENNYPVNDWHKHYCPWLSRGGYIWHIHATHYSVQFVLISSVYYWVYS